MIVQLYIFYSMANTSKVLLVPLGDSSHRIDEVKTFVLKDAECSEAQDKLKICSVIEKAPGGIQRCQVVV